MDNRIDPDEMTSRILEELSSFILLYHLRSVVLNKDRSSSTNNQSEKGGGEMKAIKKKKEPTLEQLEKRKKRSDQDFQRLLKRLRRKLEAGKDLSSRLLSVANGEK